MDFLYSCTLTKCFIHYKVTLAGRSDQLLQQLFLCQGIEILGMSQTITAGLQAADSLLESFLISLTDTHDFADCTHLCTQLVLNAFKFLECPAGELDYNIVSIGNILVQSTVFSARDVFQSQAGCQHCTYQCDRESGSLGSKCGRTGCSGVDFDNDNTVGYRVVGELYVSTADNLYGLYDLVCLFLQTLLTFLGNGQHRSGTEGVTGVYA